MSNRPCCGGKLRERGPGRPTRSHLHGLERRGRSAIAAAAAAAMGIALAWLPANQASVAAPESIPSPKAAAQPSAAATAAKECPMIREMCILADEQGEIDVKSGTADLKGNVRGYLHSRELEFRAQRLRAQQQGSKRVWRHLELNGAVNVSQPGRRITADHAVIEPDVATLFGKVRLEEEDRWLEGDEVVVEEEAQRVTAKGTFEKPLVLFVADAAADADPKPEPEGASAGRLRDGTRVKAQRAVMEEGGRSLQLTGAVHVEMAARQLSMDAESVTLQFAEDQTLLGFQARGNVVVVQPGRRLTADSARSQNRMQTILLQGKARMRQEGQFDLNSDRLEVFTDTKRGAVRSEDRQRPMTLSLDLSSAKPWRLNAAGMAKLKAQGVPDPTLKKLEPLRGRNFTTQAAFQQAASDRLSPEESERYLSTIVAQAKP